MLSFIRQSLTLLVSILLLVACRAPDTMAPHTVEPTDRERYQSVETVTPISAPARATPQTPLAPSPALPTLMPVAQATTTVSVTPTRSTPTPDPYADLLPYTIEGLRMRSYGNGAIELLRVMEEMPRFTRYLFAYPSDDLRITGMLNRPHGTGPFPVVILNHGYYPLNVYQTGNGTRLAADYLAERGFLTLSPDFRSHAGSDPAPNVFRAGHVIDTLNLIPLAQQLPDAQPGTIGMWGHSNGGAITAKVITISDQVELAVIYAPASANIVQDYWFRVERAALRGALIDPVDWPLTPDAAPDLYERLSPLNYVHYVNARVRIIWGTADEIVPRQWPEDLYNHLRAANKDVEFIIYDGQPHSFNAVGNATYLPWMVDVFRTALIPE